MNQLFKTLSLAPKGIRYKLAIAFALMSVIPMLVCGYIIFYYIFPKVQDFADVSLLFMLTVIIMILGFYLAKKIIYPIAKLAIHAKDIAEGRLDGTLEIKGEDEIGELSGSLNRLSSRLRENMAELHSYGEKIKQINMEINKKVFALSSLLQIGNLITTSIDLDEVFNLIVEKLSQLESGGPAFLMLLDKEINALTVRAQVNIPEEDNRHLKVKVGQGLLGRVVIDHQQLVQDSQKYLKPEDQNLKKLLATKNMAVLPITSFGRVIGLLGTGNNTEDFLFTKDEVELIGVFAKQVAVAIENASLLSKTKELAIKDELTDLYNEKYIRNRLDEEIKRAISCQRPCSFIILELGNLEQYRRDLGETTANKLLKDIAQLLKEGTDTVDKVARFGEHQFAIVLPEKNKRQASLLAGNIRKEIERCSLKNSNRQASSIALALKIGISATPIDGVSALELTNKGLSEIENG